MAGGIVNILDVVGLVNDGYGAICQMHEGTLSAFGGAAESRTIDVENTTLFEFRNGATESFTKGNYNAAGNANISGEATNIKIVASNVGSGTTFVSGEKIEKQTDNYLGSGLQSGRNELRSAKC